MAYDGLDRLTQVTSNMFGTASYGYDVLDNLAHVQLSGGQARDQYYCYDAAWRLANVKTSSCTGTTVVGLGYDVQGNLANKNGQVYEFDYGNRLRRATNKEWYAYDGQGRRVLSCNTSACDYQQYAYDGKLYFHRDYRAAKEYFNVYLGNSLVAIREQPVAGGAATVLYQHTDALGTPIAVTDANKALAQTSEYEPYGQLLNRTLTDGVGFTGHVQDASTGLTYMQQRYYDSAIGAFLSVDPVTAYDSPIGAFNRYWYANNNPYKFTDPDGRQSWCAGAACSIVNVIQDMKRGVEDVSAKVEVVNQKIEKIDVRLEGSIAMGPGLTGSVSLLRGDGEIGFVAVGQGADIGISLQPRNPIKINLTDNPVDAPMSFNGPLDLKAGGGLHGGVEVSFNPGGSLDVTPKVGVGTGEFFGYSPAIKFLEWKIPESWRN